MPQDDAEHPGTAQPPAVLYAATTTSTYTLQDSNVAARTKLRAKTSEIVGCVAKYCQELEEDAVRTRQQANKAKQTSPGKCDTVSSTEMGRESPPEAEHGAEASKMDSDQLSRSPEEVQQSENGSGAQKQDKLSEPSDDTRSERQGDGSSDESSAVRSLVNNDEDGGLAPLGLPPLQLEALCGGYSALKQNGEDWLGRIVAMHDADVSNEESKSTDGLTLWTSWEGPDFAEEALFNRIEQQPETREMTVNSPRRMQIDWCEAIECGEHFLHDESNALLRRMVRVNTQAALLVKNIAVPNVFEGDWGRELLDVHPPCSIMEGGEGIQQLLLPCDIVREDDAEVMNAPSKFFSLADKYLRGLQCSDVSLTKAAMNSSSVWNHAVTVDRLAELTAETPKIVTASAEAHLAFVQVDPPAVVQEKTMTDRSDSHGNTSKSEDSPSRAAKQVETSCSLQGTSGPPNLAIAAEESPLGTDYFMSDTFLNCNWDEPPEAVGNTVTEEVNSHDPKRSPRYEEFLQQIARPALWDLRRKKLIQVNGTSFKSALNCVSLETLEAIIYQQFREVKKMSLNPSTASSVEIIDACASLRQATWLHTLRIVSISQMAVSRNGDMMSAVVAKILPSAKYKLVLGPSNWKDLYSLLEAIGGNAESLKAASHPALDSTAANASEADPTPQPPHKRQKVLRAEQEVVPVRVLCSIQFLQQDELLDELCTEQRIFFIERDLPPPIDILIDERNCICVVNEATFQVQGNVRNFIFGLARLQVQFQKCWIIIALDAPVSSEMGVAMNLFYAALVQFRSEIQVFTSFSAEEASRCVRAVVDGCADIALNSRRILPRMWFERPFLLEEESQFERFLVSTKIVNHYAAQSLLHKICIVDLFTKQIDELKVLVQNAVTFEQLQLLWGFVQQDHGLNSVMQQQYQRGRAIRSSLTG